MSVNEKNKNIKKLIEYPGSGILSKSLAKTSELDVTLFCMAKGTEMSEHTSTSQGFVYVVEGRGVFDLEGRNIPMLPGVFIFMEENAVHSLRVSKNTSFILSLHTA